MPNNESKLESSKLESTYGKLAESRMLSRSVDRTLSDQPSNSYKNEFILRVHKCKSQDTAREPSMREVQ